MHFARFVQIHPDGHMHPVEALHRYIPALGAWSCSIIRMVDIQNAPSPAHEAAAAVAVARLWKAQRS